MADDCPKCGTEFRERSDQARVRICEYCGWVDTPETNLLAADDTSGLPAEYRDLERPQPAEALQATGKRYSLFFGILWTLLSLFFLVLAIRSFLNYQALYQLLISEGRVVQAVIIRLEKDESDDSTLYTAHYRFEASVNGSVTCVDAQEGISAEQYAAMHEGQRVNVVYAPAEPSKVLLQANLKPPLQSDQMGVLAGVGVGVLFVLIGARTVYRAFTGLDKVLVLRLSGRIAAGMLIARWQENDPEEGPSYAVTVAFKVPDASGAVKTVVHSEYNRMAYEKLRVGGGVQVRYRVDAPQICQLVL